MVLICRVVALMFVHSIITAVVSLGIQCNIIQSPLTKVEIDGHTRHEQDDESGYNRMGYKFKHGISNRIAK